ncbi:probable S-adenosylmethionine-dependent methyltransferase At5g37990, partial [Quercus lobata]|uniref:probable S-adenosylmethionine-dependent methyltransferase At5g37990 n=1 Tax=Quercus lobata TaxID=97700 RepID=UPI001246E5E3
FALNWLSKVPKEVMDDGSPAWNKGRIFYTNAPKEVVDAYATQFAKDIELFLFARAQELVFRGLLAVILPVAPDVTSNSDTFTGTKLDLLGYCLMDMAKMGLLSEAKVDAFNTPVYFTMPKELKALIGRSGNFSFEKMEKLKTQKKHLFLQTPSMRSLFLRALLEGLLERQFGNDMMDELFDRYSEKITWSSYFLIPETDKTIELFVILKPKN